MMKNNSVYYTVLVAGDVDLRLYDATRVVELYTVYKYSDREKLQKTVINEYRQLAEKCYEIDNPQITSMGDAFYTCAEDFEDMTSEEFFQEFTKKYNYNDNGDAVSTINPNGKYSSLYEPTLETTVPLFGDENASPFSGLRSNVIDNPSNTDINLALFYNAFVSEDTGWVEQADEDQECWVLTFYDRFIKPLQNNTTLKIYNFVK